MTIEDCPGCHHPRKSHDGGSCFHIVDAVTAGGEIHPTLCGFCSWEPFVNHNGIRGWRHVAESEPVMLHDDVSTAAIAEAERILGLR